MSQFFCVIQYYVQIRNETSNLFIFMYMLLSLELQCRDICRIRAAIINRLSSTCGSWTNRRCRCGCSCSSSCCGSGLQATAPASVGSKHLCVQQLVERCQQRVCMCVRLCDRTCSKWTVGRGGGGNEGGGDLQGALPRTVRRTRAILTAAAAWMRTHFAVNRGASAANKQCHSSCRL